MILFDDQHRDSLLPFTFTRPAAHIRCGILTIAEKWENVLDASATYATQTYLQKRFGAFDVGEQLWINGRVLPTEDLVIKIKALTSGEALIANDILIAAKTTYSNVDFIKERSKLITCDVEIIQIKHSWDIFQLNEKAISLDWNILNVKSSFKAFEKHNTIIGNDIYIHPKAKVQGAFLNATTGPIYIGAGAEIMEGSLIRGPFALCDGATVKMGAKIYGATTIGPQCKVGGEVSNSVLFAYSNKGHDGFLGNSVLGEWCNLGADTNTSNLKNNYGPVRAWNYVTEAMENTTLQFCGLMMGDHSKSSINTMFNTGTVVGVAANVFGSGFPSKFIPSFSWGGAHGFETFNIDKAYEVAERMMERRNIMFDKIDKEIFSHIFSETKKYRR